MSCSFYTGGKLHQGIAGSSPPNPTHLHTFPNLPEGFCTTEEASKGTFRKLHKVPLRSYSWKDSCDRKKLRRIFQNLREAPESIASLAPFVIRGAAHSWPACMPHIQQMQEKAAQEHSRRWTVDTLVRREPGLGGLVRVAPTLQFPFVMPAHACDVARLSRTEAVIPSTTRQV